jgi:predicted nucleic acid-binding protein
VLVSLARTDIFRARWSADINAEWKRTRLAKRPALAAEIDRTEGALNSSVPDCLVTGYESLIPALTLPDPNDRHVLAAAIKGRADVIVTLNLKHFPRAALSPYDIDVQSPDGFIAHQLTLDKDRALIAFKAMRSRLRQPPMTAEEFIHSLESKGLGTTASLLRQYETSI